MTASILGSGLSFRSTVFVVLAAITIAAWILLSLVPVALFFLLSGVSSAGTHDELRYAHNSILVTHTEMQRCRDVLDNLFEHRWL